MPKLSLNLLEIGVQGTIFGIDQYRGLGNGGGGQHRDFIDTFAISGRQLIHISKIQAPHGTGIYTNGIFARITQGFAAIALTGYSRILDHLWKPIWAIPCAISTAYTFVLVNLNGFILCIVHSAGRTAFYAFSFGAVITGSGVMIHPRLRVYTGFKAPDPPVNDTQVKSVSVLAGYLTSAASDAHIGIKVKTQ
jgi:hypothetical protein